MGKELNILSLFDGMGCFAIALKESNIKYNTYYSSEIDKFANQQTALNFPDHIQLNSICDVDVSKLKPIGFLGGGSPCQSFSFAGKRQGMATKCEMEILSLEHYLELKLAGFEFNGQSYLFWEFIRILTDIRKYNPDVKFLLENVEMGEKWEKVLSKAIGVNGIHINSALVSAQNRKRIYWTNIGLEPGGLFSDLESIIEQPKDRKILLKDILQSVEEVDDKYYLSDEIIQRLVEWGERNKTNGNGFSPNFKTDSEKSAVLTTSSWKSDATFIKLDKNLNLKNNQDKASCFTAGAHSGGNHSDMDLIDFHKTDNYIQWDGYAQDCRAYFEAGKSGTIDIKAKRLKVLLNDFIIRRLTPKEACRLQTIPDWYKWDVSDSQQYKMLGNGWTVQVICHILSYLERQP